MIYINKLTGIEVFVSDHEYNRMLDSIKKNLAPKSMVEKKIPAPVYVEKEFEKTNNKDDKNTAKKQQSNNINNGAII